MERTASTASSVGAVERVASGRPALSNGARALTKRISAPRAALVLGFVASRVLLGAAGVRFVAEGLPRFFQYVDPALLRERLLESVFYLHSQPPLFNLFLGLGIKLAPDDYALLFRFAFHVFGLALALALYALLVALRFSPWTAAGLALAAAVSPPVLLAESWLFYDHPVAALLVASVVALHAYAVRPSFGRAAAFFATAAALVLTRSVFQAVWLALVLALVLLSVRTRRTTLLAAAVPLVLVAAVYAKNAVVFGTYSTSSWHGLSLARTVLPNVDLEERRRLAREGTVSALALLWPYRPLDRFPARLVETDATGVPVLDRRTKTSGAANYNHSAYIRLSRRYAGDTLTVIRRRPDAYLRGVGIGAGRFFDAGTDDPAFRGNRQRLGAWAAAYERLFVRAELPGGVPMSAMMVLYPLAVAYGLWRVVAGDRRERRLEPKAVALAYALLTIAYVAVVWLATDNGETFRARMLVEPLVLFVLLPLAVRDGLEAARHRLPTAAARP